MLGKEDLVRNHKRNAILLAKLIIIAFIVILARLWYLQMYKGKLLYNYSLKNRLRQERVAAPRGMIYDREGRLIVNNVPQFDAVITPQYLRNRTETIRRLSKILNIPVKDIINSLKKKSYTASYRPVVIKKNISEKEVALIETKNMDLPGVSVETQIGRVYAHEGQFSHILGYISEITADQMPRLKNVKTEREYTLGSLIGQFGIELKYDQVLRGIDGHEFMEVDANGRKRRYINTDNFFKGIKNNPVRPGDNINLTIDSDLQKVAYDSLQGKVGSAVVYDIHTGKILAMVSTPSFDPEKFGRGIASNYWNELIQNPNRPLINKAVQEHYAPGSTFKIISALTALEEGIVDNKTEVNCTGVLKLGNRKIHCWKRYGHGKMKLRQAIRESCNIYFYKIGMRLDIDILAKYAKMFNAGSILGIDLPREIPGLMPTREWKKKVHNQQWALGETVACAIGQSHVLFTPLQLAITYGAIANGGKVFRPYLVDTIADNAGNILKKTDPQVINTVEIDPKNLKMIQQGLYQAVNHIKGTSYWRSRGQGIHMAGKTGTSQVIRMSPEKLFEKCDLKEYKYRNHGVFAGFVPYNDPQIAISVVVEHGCGGSRSAAPLAKDIATAYMKKYMPKMHLEIAAKEKRLQRQAYLKQQERLRRKEKADADDV